MIDKYSVRSKAALLRGKSPLVLNITNYVAMNFSANVLLAAGASPIMSYFSEEMEELVDKCDSIVINIGCPGKDFREGARRAAEAALTHGKPWVLDPVGVAASSDRKFLCKELLGFHPTIIRGNASEIVALNNFSTGCDAECHQGRGTDSTIDSTSAIQAAKELARSSNSIVSVSGAIDYITDGNIVRKVEGGSPLMPQVTAMGCSASALTAAMAAVEEDAFCAAFDAMAIMSLAGEIAESQTSLPGTFAEAFIDAIRLSGRKCFDRSFLKLYLVTDRGLAKGRDITEIVSQAAAGGVTMVQLREKGIDTDEFIALAKRLKAILKRQNIPLIVNDRVDVALASDADGVHLGQSDMPYSEARHILGPDKIIGLSVENLEQVIMANSIDVDYIGISPVFDTPTKTNTAKAFGISGMIKAAKLSVHPTVAIGGINKTNADEVIRTGADGIAVVSAIVSSDCPEQSSKELLNIIDNASQKFG